VKDDARPNTIQYGMTEHAPAIPKGSCAGSNRLWPLRIRRMLDPVPGERAGSERRAPSRRIATRAGEKGKGEAVEVKRANRTEVNAQWI